MGRVGGIYVLQKWCDGRHGACTRLHRTLWNRPLAPSYFLSSGSVCASAFALCTLWLKYRLRYRLCVGPSKSKAELDLPQLPCTRRILRYPDTLVTLARTSVPGSLSPSSIIGRAPRVFTGLWQQVAWNAHIEIVRRSFHHSHALQQEGSFANC